MKFVLDTSGYIAFAQGNPAVVTAIRHAEVVFVPVTVYAELTYGFYKGTKTAENLASLEQFLAVERVQLVETDEKMAEVYGRLRVSQEAAGKVLAPNDLWIAAACLYLGLPLLTTDSDFRVVQALELVQLDNEH